jgi:hypothetical protein
MLNHLIELVGLINKTKLRMNGVWDSVIEPDSRMEALFDAIAQKKVLTDEDARKHLYQPGEDAGTLTSLKNKLKDRLLDAVFLLDFKEANFTSRQKAFFECSKKWAGANILLVRNAKLNGIDQLEKLLRHSIRFEFTELSLDILRVLRLQYSTIEGDFKKYEAARDQARQYEAIWRMENRAEEYYADLMVRYTNSKSTKTEVTEQALAHYRELEPWMATCQSFKLHLFGRLIHLLVYSSGNDYAATSRICEEAIDFFDRKDYDSGLPLQVFYYNLIVCYLQLREFDKGRVIVEKSERLFEDGSFNWFKLQELFFLLALHTAHWEEAYRIYLRVAHHPRFESQAPQIIEMWKIFQAYVHYLIRIGKITEVGGRGGKFRINKFLNEIPVFSKDKRGMNISILIVQILFSIAERDYDQSVERIEGIEKYCTRYLKGEDTIRSNCFIKMLLQIPLANFHREAVKRKTEKYRRLLQSVPLEAANQTHEIEIIPFETLWETILETLDLKIHKAGVKKQIPTH